MNLNPIGNTRKDKDATIDHVIPRCKNGSDKESNLVVACYNCNNKKGNLLIYVR